MQRCLNLASKGLGYTYPNPMVGAVVVHKGKIIGEGWHKKAGKAHAEVHAIDAVADKTKLADASLVVSLEPCSHYGKTPPCTKLIIESGIKHVIIGMQDPFDAVRGRGIQQLQDAGVKVEVGILEQACRELNKRFLSAVEKKRPYVVLKWATSADGFIAPEHQITGQPYWITEPPARQLAHKWRAEEQAILVGRKTIEMDNPRLDVRLWSGENPTRLIIDPSCKTNMDSHVLNTNDTIYIYNNLKEEVQKNIHYVLVDFNQNPLTQILEHLQAVNIQSVMVEGGASTQNKFINEGLWDEARVLTGINKIGKGVMSPQLPGHQKATRQYMCGNDKVSVFKNPSSFEKEPGDNA